MALNPRHGEVWLADMGLAAKVRPVVVLLEDNLEVERTLIVHVPITTQNRGSPLEVGVGHLRFLERDCVANVQAIGSLPRVRFKRRLGILPPDDLQRVKQAIRLAPRL
jgi:mRNA interferase MazF